MALAIMCSGGDAPGMNAAVKKFVDYLFERKEVPYLIYDGLEGLIDGRIKKAGHSDVAGILHRGGSVIRSSRSKRFYEKRHRRQAFENLRSHNIEGLVVLGGDGSFRAMEIFSAEFPVSFAGIPTTIDNDIYGTEYCLGVDTALNTIRDALDKIYDTASSFKRAFVVEVMGRECGYLALISAISSGAEICVIPEVEFNRAVEEDRLRREIEQGRGYILAIVAEGTGKTAELAEWLEKTMGFESRITVLGHIQRGGAPTTFDRMMGFEFTVQAVDHLRSPRVSNRIVVYNKGEFGLLDIDTAVNGKYRLNPHHLAMLNLLD
jgi:6-phosphofructokinase 1